MLAHHARYVLPRLKPRSKSWFLQIQNLCLQYDLPHPITFLDNPHSKITFKNLTKSKVIDYWEKQLRAEASHLDSLQYFHPQYMSLSTSHPLFSTCNNSPYQATKAVIQSRYLSGRARVESLTKHWTPSNPEGICQLCADINPTPGNLEHLLLSGGCPALADARLSMLSFMQAYMVSRPYLLPLFKVCWDKDPTLTMQFLLDCSVIPAVISLNQETSGVILHDVFYLTRTYIFKVHITRRRLLLKI